VRVVVCGSRDWRDAEAIKDRLRSLPRGTVIISGGARGADRLAATVARGMGFEVKEYIPNWRVDGRYDPRAGFKRNIVMLEQEPGLVLAFWDGRSTGTKHTITEALARNIHVEIIYPRTDHPRRRRAA
jgi:hypothetical protein